MSVIISENRALKVARSVSGMSHEAVRDAVRKSQTPRLLADALEMGNNAGLFSQTMLRRLGNFLRIFTPKDVEANFACIINTSSHRNVNPVEVTQALIDADKQGLLAGRFGDVLRGQLSKDKRPQELINAIIACKDAKFLSYINADNLPLFADHPNRVAFAGLLKSAYKVGLFSYFSDSNPDEVVRMLLRSKNPSELRQALQEARDATTVTWLFGLRDANEIMSLNHPLNYVKAVKAARHAGLLAREYDTLDNDLDILARLETTRHPEQVVKALAVLHKVGLLTEGNLNRVMRHRNIEQLSDAMERAYQGGLFTPSMTQRLKSFDVSVLNRVANAMETVDFIGFFPEIHQQENLEAVLSKAEPVAFVEQLLLAQKAGFLSKTKDANERGILLQHQKPEELRKALNAHKGKLSFFFNTPLTTEYQNAIKRHKNPVALEQAIDSLDKLDIYAHDWSRDKIEAFLTHRDPLTVVKIMDLVFRMYHYDIDDPNDVVDAVLRHTNPEALADVLEEAYQDGLFNFSFNQWLRESQSQPWLLTANVLSVVGYFDFLTQQVNKVSNFDAILSLSPTKLAGLKVAMHAMHQSDFFKGSEGQTHFNELVNNLSEICGTKRLENLWSRVPEHALTQEKWSALLTICTQPNVQIHLKRASVENLINRELVAPNIVPDRP